MSPALMDLGQDMLVGDCCSRGSGSRVDKLSVKHMVLCCGAGMLTDPQLSLVLSLGLWLPT